MANRPQLNDINSEQGLIGLGPLASTAPVAAFNIDQIENLLRTKGFTAYHYKHAYNPIRNTLQAGENPIVDASHRGVVYYKVREFKIIPQNFKLEDRLNAQGIFSQQSVLFNITGQYTDGDQEPIYMRPKDLIVMNPTITTEVAQLIPYNPNGPLRLNYKVKGVDVLFSEKRTFIDGVDFEVKDDGLIYWMANGSKPDFIDGKGDVLSVVYAITPIYVVESCPHSLRVIPSNEIGHGALPREATYAPQLIVAIPLHLREPNDLLDAFALPAYPGNPNSSNVMGGAT